MSDMDMLVVFRVAPTQSWTNPAERCMGPISLALQNCALSRSKLADDAMEAHMRRCNGMSYVRSKAEEFDIASSVGIEGNENEDIEATVPLTAIPLTRPTNLSRGHDIEDFDEVISSVEPVEQRYAIIANLEDEVATPSPSTTPRIYSQRLY